MPGSRPNITYQLRPKAVEDLAGLELDKRKAALKDTKAYRR